MTIAAPVLAQIHRHLEAGYPAEACGVLLGRDGVVSEVVPVTNQQIDSRQTRFLIGPRDYARIERDADRRGTQVLGIYHSHPDGAARPSATDLEGAWPGLSYLIVAVVGGKAVASTCWRLDERQPVLEPEPLHCP